MSLKRLQRVGLELYSVRDAMKKDPLGTLSLVHNYGYDDVELLWTFDNFGLSTREMRAALDERGLRAPSAHIAPEALLLDWQKSLDTAKALDHAYLIVPSLPDDTNGSLDGWRRWADRFNVAGEAARKAGLWLAFHNEPGHQKPIAGQVPYDLFVERTDPQFVRLQLDVGNMAMGGGDPVRYIEKYHARYASLHIKDVVADRSHDTELGAGTLDLRAILRRWEFADAGPCYIEQEGAADPMDSARKNHYFLSRLEF